MSAEERVSILIVDDEPAVRRLLRRAVEEEGFEVGEAASAGAARAELERRTFDLVTLDLGLPHEGGLSLARELRASSDIPIIIISGKDDVVDRVLGLEIGADDYVTKPFHVREVVARIRSVLRRQSSASRQPPSSGGRSGERLRFAGWMLDLAARELRAADGKRVALTSGEFDLLHMLARHPHRTLSRDEIMTGTKGRDWAAYDRSVDAMVTRLRKKIEADPSRPAILKTVRGVGYIFCAEVLRG